MSKNIILGYVKPFSSDTGTLRTDGRTDRQICYINIDWRAIKISINENVQMLWITIQSRTDLAQFSNDMEHRAASLWQLNFLFHLSCECHSSNEHILKCKRIGLSDPLLFFYQFKKWIERIAQTVLFLPRKWTLSLESIPSRFRICSITCII